MNKLLKPTEEQDESQAIDLQKCGMQEDQATPTQDQKQYLAYRLLSKGCWRIWARVPKSSIQCRRSIQN